MKLLKRNMIFR